MVDATDLKSVSLYREWGFESLPGHHFVPHSTGAPRSSTRRTSLVPL